MLTKTIAFSMAALLACGCRMFAGGTNRLKGRFRPLPMDVRDDQEVALRLVEALKNKTYRLDPGSEQENPAQACFATWKISEYRPHRPGLALYGKRPGRPQVSPRSRAIFLPRVNEPFWFFSSLPKRPSQKTFSYVRAFETQTGLISLQALRCPPQPCQKSGQWQVNYSLWQIDYEIRLHDLNGDRMEIQALPLSDFDPPGFCSYERIPAVNGGKMLSARTRD